MAKWIAVNKRMPAETEIVDVWLSTGYRIPDVSYVWNGGTEGFWDWHFTEGMDEGHSFQELGIDSCVDDKGPVTHWMRRPAPPKASK